MVTYLLYVGEKAAVVWTSHQCSELKWIKQSGSIPKAKFIFTSPNLIREYKKLSLSTHIKQACEGSTGKTSFYTSLHVFSSYHFVLCDRDTMTHLSTHPCPGEVLANSCADQNVHLTNRSTVYNADYGKQAIKPSGTLRILLIESLLINSNFSSLHLTESIFAVQFQTHRSMTDVSFCDED